MADPSQFPSKFIWQNGDLVPFAEAKMHVATIAARSGCNVFEGIRAYWSPEDENLYGFRLAEHYRRLHQSAKMIHFDPLPPPELLTAHLIETLLANQIREDVHIVHMIYLDNISSIYAVSGPVSEVIICRPRGRQAAWDNGVRLGVSSWLRIDDRDTPPRLKAGANYHNGRLATLEAAANGFDGAILLNHDGKVAEHPGACIGILRDGKFVTPSVTSGILESITRATVMELASADLGVPVVEREVDRTELYLADEAFLCGTNWEVTPIVSVDRLPVGDGQVGPFVRSLQGLYLKAAKGRHPRYRHWVTATYQNVVVERSAS